MNLAQVARLLAGFTAFSALAQLIPLLVALGDGSEFDTVSGFATGVAIGVAIAAALLILSRGQSTEFYRRESTAVVGLSWLVAGALGAVPLVWSGALSSFSDGFFEAVSGLTTTGASVFGTAANPAIDDLPPSILLWRSLLQWMGGLGIIMVFIVLLPAMGVTGKNLLASEQVGVSTENLRPRMQEQGRLLFRLYVGLTAAAGLCYWAAGMNAFEALCHALTTLATGGFSTRGASVGAFDSVAVELAVIVFMFLAGCNFSLLLSTVRGGRVEPRRLWANAEFRTYALLTAVVIAVITVVLRAWAGGPTGAGGSDYAGLGHCLRAASFQAVSILTSTGFCTADFQTWPRPVLLVLTLCMLIGGCTGSTAGGLKVLRVLICGKLVTYSIRQYLRPRSVQKLKLGDEVIPNAIISAVLALLLLWLAAVGLGALVLSFETGVDAVGAITCSASMMGCTGPSITGVVESGGAFHPVIADGLDLGPYGGYGGLRPLTKVALALQMILGRLEVMAPIALLAPAFWRK